MKVVISNVVTDYSSTDRIYCLEVYKDGNKVARMNTPQEVERYFNVNLPVFLATNVMNTLKDNGISDVSLVEMNVG